MAQGPAHAEREGQVLFWDEPPPGGHPGHDVSCRCQAEPVLPVLDNPGIAWGQGIRRQGIPWEDALERRLGDGMERLPPTFPVFDFVTPDQRIAVSAKTLDLAAPVYANNPRAIYGQLRGYIDHVADADQPRLGTRRLNAALLLERRIELAVPDALSVEQQTQLRRAVEYAADRGINLVVTRIR